MRRLATLSFLALAAALLVGSASMAVAEDAKAATGTITGKVLDSDGNAVKGANVGAVPVDAKPAEGKRFPEPVARATTGDDGTFKLEKVPVGKYNVRAFLQGKGMGRVEAIEVKANEETKAGDIKLAQRQGGGRRNGGGAKGGDGK